MTYSLDRRISRLEQATTAVDDWQIEEAAEHYWSELNRLGRQIWTTRVGPSNVIGCVAAMLYSDDPEQRTAVDEWLARDILGPVDIADAIDEYHRRWGDAAGLVRYDDAAALAARIGG